MSDTELIAGHKSIAKALGLTPRQVKRMDDQKLLPTFKLGRNVCIRRATLLQWITDQERVGKRSDGPTSKSSLR